MNLIQRLYQILKIIYLLQRSNLKFNKMFCMEKILKKFTYTVMAIAILFITLISFVCGGVGVTYAATSNSEVLADLRKDPDFDESAYPYVKDDYGLHVIQIAESSNKELFVYAYQPCHDTYDLKGTKISISYGYSLNGTDLSPKLYNLRLVSTSGTLDKYYVEDFTVPNDGDRYYNIVEIFRMINSEIDGEQDETNPKTDKAYPVGQQWRVYDVNDTKKYEMNTFKTKSFETVFGGCFYFSNGFKLNNLLGEFDQCNAWFYAFTSEEHIIEHIFNATLSYSITPTTETRRTTGTSIEKGDKVDNQSIKLDETDVMSYKGDGLNARKFEWNRIISAKDFISQAEEQKVAVSDEIKSKLLSYDDNGNLIDNNVWVFSYLETPFELYVYDSFTIKKYSDVSDVGLLQISFQDITGARYDVGVVNDLTNPDSFGDGYGSSKSLTEMFEEFWDKFVKIILTIVGVILLVLLLNFVPPVMGILKFIFKAIVFVICAPFKLLKSIFKKE